MTLNDDFSFRLPTANSTQIEKYMPIDSTRVMLKYIIIPAVIVLVVGVLVSYYNQQVYLRMNSHRNE